MTWLWPMAFFLTAAATAAVLLPLVRRPPAPPPARTEYDLAVYKDQLAEIGRDLERGLIQPAEAEAAKIEVQRRMLAAADVHPDADPKAWPAGRGRLAVAIGAAVPLAAFVIYFFLGSPELPGQPFAARDIARETTAQADPAHREMTDIADRLAEKLRQNPNDAKGWILLGRTYVTVGQIPKALEAFRRALDISGRDPDIAALYGETLVMSQNGRVTPEALALFRDVAKAEPMNPQARYYIGLALAQEGKVMEALREWVDLKALAPADAPWLAALDEQIERARQDLNLPAEALVPSPQAREMAKRLPPAAAAMPPGAAAGTQSPGPSAADIEAARQMAPEAQSQMIRGMVERLAERLKQNPDDLEGWRRLARAYEVLGETAKASEAKARVEALEKKAR